MIFSQPELQYNVHVPSIHASISEDRTTCRFLQAAALRVCSNLIMSSYGAFDRARVHACKKKRQGVQIQNYSKRIVISSRDYTVGEIRGQTARARENMYGGACGFEIESHSTHAYRITPACAVYPAVYRNQSTRDVL